MAVAVVDVVVVVVVVVVVHVPQVKGQRPVVFATNSPVVHQLKLFSWLHV